MPNKQKLSPEEKGALVRRYQAGELSINSLSNIASVDWETAKTWITQYDREGIAAFMPRTELERLQIEKEQLKHKRYLAEIETALLKKLDEVERRDAYRK